MKLHTGHIKGQKTNFQIRYNACHERQWSDSYLLTVDDVKVGYGSVKGKEALADRDAIFEFLVIPSFQKMADQLFYRLIAKSGAIFIECQSNDLLLSSMQFEFSSDIHSDVFLFENYITTDTKMPDVIFRFRKKSDTIFEQVAGLTLSKEREV